MDRFSVQIVVGYSSREELARRRADHPSAKTEHEKVMDGNEIIRLAKSGPRTSSWHRTVQDYLVRLTMARTRKALTSVPITNEYCVGGSSPERGAQTRGGCTAKVAPARRTF